MFENKNSRLLGKTVLRGNFESGKGSRTPPTSFAPSIAYEPFFIPPPNLQPYTGQDYPLGGGYANLTANWRKWAVNDTRRIEVSPGNFQAGWYESLATASQAGRPDLVAKNHSSSHIFIQQGLVYNGSGTATIGIPGSNLQAFQGWVAHQAGQLSFTNPFINTRAYQDGAQNVGFKAPTLRNTDVFNYRDSLTCVELGASTEVRHAFDTLVRLGTTPDRHTARACALQLELLVLVMQRAMQPGTPSGRRALASFERCRQHLDRNLLPLRTLGKAAASCHVDTSYLCRVFQRFHGERPFRYLQRLQMQWAAERLHHSGRLVREVADEMDIDLFQFSRTFKRIHGVSPSAFLDARLSRPGRWSRRVSYQEPSCHGHLQLFPAETGGGRLPQFRSRILATLSAP